MSWTQRAQWLAVGLIAWLVLVLLSLGWLYTPLGPRLDNALASPLIHWPPWWLRVGLSDLARPWLVLGAGALAGILIVVGLGARRWMAVLTAVLVPGVSLYGLIQLRHGWLSLGSDSFPSGHAVAGFALLAAVAIVAPARWTRQWWARVSWTVAVLAVGAGNITLHAHLPGDVIVAALLVTAVAGLLLGILAPRPVTAAPLPKRGTMGPP